MQAYRNLKQQVLSPEAPLARPHTPVAKNRGKRHRHNWGGPHPRGHVYKAGDVVKQSGIYEAIHEGEHRPAHDVVMIASDLFPPCDTCSERVRFRLIRTAPYIFTDEDFEKQS
jgi:hypothetical protein